MVSEWITDIPPRFLVPPCRLLPLLQGLNGILFENPLFEKRPSVGSSFRRIVNWCLPLRAWPNFPWLNHFSPPTPAKIIAPPELNNEATDHITRRIMNIKRSDEGCASLTGLCLSRLLNVYIINQNMGRVPQIHLPIVPGMAQLESNASNSQFMWPINRLRVTLSPQSRGRLTWANGKGCDAAPLWAHFRVGGQPTGAYMPNSRVHTDSPAR